MMAVGCRGHPCSQRTQCAGHDQLSTCGLPRTRQARISEALRVAAKCECLWSTAEPEQTRVCWQLADPPSAMTCSPIHAFPCWLQACHRMPSQVGLLTVGLAVGPCVASSCVTCTPCIYHARLAISRLSMAMHAPGVERQHVHSLPGL